MPQSRRRLQSTMSISSADRHLQEPCSTSLASSAIGTSTARREGGSRSLKAALIPPATTTYGSSVVILSLGYHVVHSLRSLSHLPVSSLFVYLCHYFERFQ